MSAEQECIVTVSNVTALARAAGLKLDSADLEHVTQRLNRLIEASSRFDERDLDSVDPLPVEGAGGYGSRPVFGRHADEVNHDN